MQARPNSVALFVPSEITSFAFYSGNEKDRMVANVLFRWDLGWVQGRGGAAGEGGGWRQGGWHQTGSLPEGNVKAR